MMAGEWLSERQRSEHEHTIIHWSRVYNSRLFIICRIRNNDSTLRQKIMGTERRGKNGRHRTYDSNNWGSCNTDILHMSHVWCHGPNCHTYKTQDRVRGSKGSKVLRTRKVKQHTTSQWYNPNNFYNYFCSNGCYNEFANAHVQQIIRIAPRTEPLETTINDPVKCDYGYTRITERGVDTAE
jgi:hypothetical protein